MIGNLRLYSKNRKEEKQLSIIEEEQRKIRLGIENKLYEKLDERTLLELKKLNDLDKKKLQEEKSKQLKIENKLVNSTVNSNYLDDSELSNSIATQSEIQEELEKLATLELLNEFSMIKNNYTADNADIQETDVIEYEKETEEHIEENDEHIEENEEEVNTLDEDNSAIDDYDYTKYKLKEHYDKLIKNISIEIENEEIHQFRTTDDFSEEQYLEEALKISNEEESEEDTKYNTEIIQQTDFDISAEAKDYSEIFKGNLAKYHNENGYTEQTDENIEHTENYNEQEEYLDEDIEICHNEIEVYTYDTQVEDYDDSNNYSDEVDIYSNSTIWDNNEQEEYYDEQYEELDDTEEDYEETYEEYYDYTEY